MTLSFSVFPGLLWVCFLSGRWIMEWEGTCDDWMRVGGLLARGQCERVWGPAEKPSLVLSVRCGFLLLYLLTGACVFMSGKRKHLVFCDKCYDDLNWFVDQPWRQILYCITVFFLGFFWFLNTTPIFLQNGEHNADTIKMVVARS